YQYLTVCSDIIGTIPKSLTPDYPTKGCDGGWREALWNITFAVFSSRLSDAIRAAKAGVHEHLISTYLAEGTSVQQRVMQMIEAALPDAQCGSEDGCYLHDSFMSSVIDDEWVKVGFPYSAVPSPSGLTISSVLAGQDPPTILFDDGGGFRTRQVFT